MTRRVPLSTEPTRSERAALAARLLEEDRAALQKAVSFAQGTETDASPRTTPPKASEEQEPGAPGDGRRTG